MKRPMLVSDDTVRGLTSISDNVAGNYIRSAVIEAQDMYYQGIVGGALYDRLCELVNSGEIDAEENGAYKALLDESQYYLAYTAVINLMDTTSVKITNAGAVRTTDEHVQAVSFGEIGQLQSKWQAKADTYCLLLEQWLVCHAHVLPELDGCQCAKIQAHYDAATTCGIWLGGVRGRKMR